MTGSPEAPLPLLERVSLRSGLTLAVYGVLCCLLLGVVHHAAEPQLRRAEQALLQQQLQALIPAADDPLARISIERIDEAAMRNALEPRMDALAAPLADPPADPHIETLYRITEAGRTTALIAQSTTQAGYAGPITLLSSLTVSHGSDAQLVGVRVTRHRETPGLGDAIDTRHSHWIHQFDNLPADTSAAVWSPVIRSQNFDHITGATITSVAVHAAVRDTLTKIQATQNRISELPVIEQFTIDPGAAP